MWERDPLNFIRSCNGIFKICARVQLVEGREICRVRYASRENEESATRCVKTTNCYTTAGRTWTGRCSQPVWNALHSNLISVITLHWTRARFKKTIRRKKSFRSRGTQLRHTTVLPRLFHIAGMKMRCSEGFTALHGSDSINTSRDIALGKLITDLIALFTDSRNGREESIYFRVIL